MMTSVYPVLMSGDVARAAAFYRDVVGFEVTFDAQWYVSLRLGHHELAVLAHDHETIPEGFGALPRGVLINLEVDDVDAVYARVVDELGHRPRLPLRDEAFGQRHFIIEAPDGVLLDVITPIEPSAEFAAAFAVDTPDPE